MRHLEKLNSNVTRRTTITTFKFIERDARVEKALLLVAITSTSAKATAAATTTGKIAKEYQMQQALTECKHF